MSEVKDQVISHEIDISSQTRVRREESSDFSWDPTFQVKLVLQVKDLAISREIRHIKSTLVYVRSKGSSDFSGDPADRVKIMLKVKDQAIFCEIRQIKSTSCQKWRIKRFFVRSGRSSQPRIRSEESMLASLLYFFFYVLWYLWRFLISVIFWLRVDEIKFKWTVIKLISQV